MRRKVTFVVSDLPRVIGGFAEAHDGYNVLDGVPLQQAWDSLADWAASNKPQEVSR